MTAPGSLKMEMLPASYYGTIDKSNPVIATLDKELKNFKILMKRISESPSFDHLSYARGSLNLFEIWKRYQPRLPSYVYEEKLIQTADFLLENKFYRLALWQGYRRFLFQYCDESLESIKDVEHFKHFFFPNGFGTEGAKLMVRALYGECQCTFLLERCRLPDLGKVQKLLGILSFLRLVMQVILPHENLCSLLYKGSLYIYNISRFLISVNHAAKALEFLLWACVCLETSVPLLTHSLLPWRSTLYCAVCVCYYDGHAAAQAEVFARRALGKINDLVKLQDGSDPQSAKTNRAIRESIIKLSVMIFKRSVYEPPKHSRGLFKPKRMRNLKHTNIGPWPRTVTERMLMELFDGHAAQFLAVLEALQDSSHRPLQSGIPNKPDRQEIVFELMSAGVSILSGIGGSSEQVLNDELPPPVKAITPTLNLIELATAGKNQVSVDAAVKFVKLLYRYEQWDMFCSLSDNVVTVLSNLESFPLRKDKLELILLKTVEQLMSAQKFQLLTDSTTDAQRAKLTDPETITDAALNLAFNLHQYVFNTAQDIQPDQDLIVDIVLFLWPKCSPVLEKTMAKIFGQIHSLVKTENQEKWVQTLFLLCEVAHVCQLADIDPNMVCEMTLRLAVTLEAMVDSQSLSGPKAALTKDSGLRSTPTEKHIATQYFTMFSKEQLKVLYDVLERGLECVSRSRETSSRCCDASAVCDTVFLQKFGGPHVRGCDGVQTESTIIQLKRRFSIDMYIELLAFQHRVSLKLIDSYSDEESTEQRKRSLAPTSQGQKACDGDAKRDISEVVLLEKIKKNKISKALWLMQKALLSYKKDPSNKGTKTLLEEALSLIERAEVEERRLATAPAPVETGLGVDSSCRPPPPVLISRTNWSMTFTPAPYALENKVHWYRIYGKEVKGVNLKVRIGDCHLDGTGEMIPSKGECLFCISGLEPNQKYLFAVAAYDAMGNLIGNAIGDATVPLLASQPLPLLTTWGQLALVAYQTGQYALAKRVCSELWSHFTLPIDPSLTQEEENKNNSEELSHTRLRPKILQLSSPVLLQLFLTSIFIHTDIHTMENELYSDSLNDGNPLIWGQEARLAECERMLVALDLALHLNNGNAALQAVVTCYGLLAPLIYYQIPSNPATQVLLNCIMVLQEIPAALKRKRPTLTTESLQHMVACMTHYVAKGLQNVKEYRMASYVVEQGKTLLQEITEILLRPLSRAGPVNQKVDRLQKKTVSAQREKLNEQLRALEITALEYNGMAELMNSDATAGTTGSYGDILMGHEDPMVLYTVIGFSTLSSAYKDVMKFKRRSRFLEFAALLMQKALQENELELVVEWEREIFSWITRRDKSLMNPQESRKPLKKNPRKFAASVIEFTKEQQKDSDVSSEKKKKNEAQGPDIIIQDKDYKALETLLRLLTPLVRRHHQHYRLRRICIEESQWRCLLNLTIAQAHLGLLRESLKYYAGAPLQLCYSKMLPFHFSLAHTGTLVKWKHISQQIKSHELCHQTSRITARQKLRKAKNIIKGATYISEESKKSEIDSESSSPRSELTIDSEISEPVTSETPSVTEPLDALFKATTFLRRAMVLAHRGGHWTSLQRVCGIMWDQLCSLAFLVEHCENSDSPSKLTLDEFYTVYSPLMVVASDLLMDMMKRLQLWKVFSVKCENLEARPLSDDALFSMRWLKNLVLNTLELLHHQGRWETLAHLALLYNSYTRERYTHIITPLLVNAQRRLLERISHFGGPPVPQPHFIHTATVTKTKVTCRNYADRQLFIKCSSNKKGPKSSAVPEPGTKRAMCLVCVPLDIEDTLRCFREMLNKPCPAVHIFLHSRTLLLLLLADTQKPLGVPFCKKLSTGRQGKVKLNKAASTVPSVGPPDRSREDYSSLGSVYTPPLPLSQIQTLLSSYNNSLKCLEANKYTFLQVEALHDLGNLHFFSGNQMSAYSLWNKALDCALQTTGVLESWDGETWGSSLSEEPLKHAGIWGCLQGALLSARIAQYILTSDISRRTKCCLLSAKLFKCLLRTTLPHPENDLKYCSYSLKMDLVPGVDLFSDIWPGQSIAANTVSSLGFLCHWLYTSGHHLTVLPLLTLYQYAASEVCREAHLAVGCRILKVKVLAELSLFDEAMKEIQSLTLGEKVPQPHSGYSGKEQAWTQKEFVNSKPLMDPRNTEVLKEVLNSRPSESVMECYGTKLIHQLLLAKFQLILAICSTIYNQPGPLSPDTEVLETQKSCKAMARSSSAPCLTEAEFLCSSTTRSSSEPHGLKLNLKKEKLTLGKLKDLLLVEASTNLSSQLLALHNTHTDPEELELAVETRLLLSSINLEQGKTAPSADQAMSALRLLHESPLFLSEKPPQSPPMPLHTTHEHSDPENEQASLPVCAPDLHLEDMPAAVEATERMGRCLWLRCRLAVVRSLVANIPGAPVFPDADNEMEAARMLKKGLAEAEEWGDPDTQALLLLQEVTLDTHRGRAPKESASTLQEAVSLLSGRRALSLHSGLALARATLLLSKLKGSGSQPLFLITQKILQQQLSTLGECIVLKAGGVLELPSTSGLRNIYHPQLPLLARTTMCLGQCLSLQTKANFSEPCKDKKPWQTVLEVLQSAVTIAQASAYRDPMLENDIMNCRGMVENALRSKEAHQE